MNTCIFSLQETYEQKRAEHLEELQRIENEMRQNFVNKVREKDLELKRNEKEVLILYFFSFVVCSLF